MPADPAPTQVLDLTDTQTLFELAIEDQELLGHTGAKLIADIKNRASEAEYTHLCFRDPIRPGIIWFTALAAGATLPGIPERGKLGECRATALRVFPGFLEKVEAALREMRSKKESAERVVMAQIPPLVMGVSGLDLVTALEYLVHAFPAMVRAWAALIFAYEEILKTREGARSARESCVAACRHAQIVGYLLASHDEDDRADPGNGAAQA